MENEDKIGELKKGETITITSVCDDYFRCVMRDEAAEEDGYSTGFVKMSDVDIPLTSISVEEKLFFDMEEEGVLDVEVEPEYATNQNFIYSSSNPAVAEIDEEGNIITKKAGSSIFTVSTVDGLHEAECIVFVYSPSYNIEWNDSGDEGGGVTENVSSKENSGKKKNKFNFQAVGYTDKSIQLTWNKQKR